MFLILAARNINLLIDNLQSSDSLGQSIRTFIVGVPQLVNSDPVHVNLDSSCLNQVLNLSYRLALRHKTIKRL